MTDFWSDPDFVRDEAEANPQGCAELGCSTSRVTPGSVYCDDHNGLVESSEDEDARLTRQMAQRGYRYVSNSRQVPAGEAGTSG